MFIVPVMSKIRVGFLKDLPQIGRNHTKLHPFFCLLKITFLVPFFFSLILYHLNKIGIETRLEILSRPKAPQILQEWLSNSEELPSPRPTKLLKNFKRFQNIKKIPKDSKTIPKDSNKIQKESKRF